MIILIKRLMLIFSLSLRFTCYIWSIFRISALSVLIGWNMLIDNFDLNIPYFNKIYFVNSISWFSLWRLFIIQILAFFILLIIFIIMLFLIRIFFSSDINFVIIIIQSRIFIFDWILFLNWSCRITLFFLSLLFLSFPKLTFLHFFICDITF